MSGLEERDPITGRWLLYRSQEEHASDCRAYPFEKIPRRIFLDTNVVNVLVKHPEQIFEQCPLPGDLPKLTAEYVEALMHIFQIGSRANWSLVASSKTLEEVSKTPKDALRERLMDYAVELAEPHGDAAIYARNLGRRIIGSDFLNALPDMNDRELIAHAIGLECDAFCTCDRKTILERRELLPKIPMRILSPVEWWRHIRPWAGLWC